MTDDQELREILHDLGHTATPDPDPAFANRLDAQLRRQHDEQLTRRRRPRLAPAVLGLAGAAVIIVAAVSLSLIGREQAVVVLTAAAETDIVLPGEAASAGVAGQQLPDGTRILVSADGEAVVGGVVLGPGAEAVVVAGRIEVLRVDDGVDAQPTTTVLTIRPSTTGGSAADRSADQSTTEPTPDPTVRPSSSSTDVEATSGPTTVTEADRATGGTASTATTATTATSVGGDARPTATTTVRSTTSTAAPTTTGRPTTVTARPPTDATIQLTATTSSPERIVLDWTIDGAPDGSARAAGWRIEAVAGDRVTILAVLRDGRARTATVARIEARGVGFRVVVVDADGADLGASEVVAQPPD